MNKKKTSMKVESEIFDVNRMKVMMKEIWEPSMALLLAKHVEIAMKDDKVGYEARKDIFDRYFGKPVETMRQDSNMQINITISPVGLEGKEEESVVLLQGEEVSYDPLPAPPLGDVIETIVEEQEENTFSFEVI